MGDVLEGVHAMELAGTALRGVLVVSSNKTAAAFQEMLLRAAILYFFFFQAEDGIRDVAVTGVQTCALPICYSRHRADFYIPNDRPKRLWLRPLVPQARQLLRSVDLPQECRAGLNATPCGTLPVNAEQLGSLLDVFRKAPDPRDANTRYRIGPVLTLIAMALLAGRREIAEIARFATTLTQPQRRRLGLPRKKGTRAFHEVPGYGVFYQVLTRMDPEAFATRLNGWLQSQAGTLPQALALDGKMIRDHIGLLTLAQHEDGAPQAMAVYDQKEGTERCEQTAALALLESLEALDGKMITADPLHCPRTVARAIVENGGDYLLQIKGY